MPVLDGASGYGYLHPRGGSCSGFVKHPQIHSTHSVRDSENTESVQKRGSISIRRHTYVSRYDACYTRLILIPKAVAFRAQDEVLCTWSLWFVTSWLG